MDATRPIRYGDTMAAILRHAPDEVKWYLVDREVLHRHLDAGKARDEGRELYQRFSAQQDARQRQGVTPGLGASSPED